MKATTVTVDDKKKLYAELVKREKNIIITDEKLIKKIEDYYFTKKKIIQNTEYAQESKANVKNEMNAVKKLMEAFKMKWNYIGSLIYLGMNTVYRLDKEYHYKLKDGKMYLTHKRSK